MNDIEELTSMLSYVRLKN